MWAAGSAGGAGALRAEPAGIFAGCEFDAVGLELLTGSGEVVGSGFESTKGGTFGCRWGVGLQLLSNEGNQWGMKGTGLGCFVGDCCALRGMQGLDRIQVKALVADFLQQVSCED